MELYNLENSIEWRLAFKADIGNHPLGGTMELTPMCNMNCKMCYIRHDKSQVDAEGGLLTVDQWLKIAEDAKKAGVLFLLITGGEPFTYPGFERLYRELMNMGFIIQINTNGTALTEEHRKMLVECPPRKLNITLYGTSDEEYAQICGNPQGYSQVMETVQFLLDHQILFAFNYTLAEENIASGPQILRIASACGTDVTAAHYLFAPTRKEKQVDFKRLPAKLVVECMIRDRLGGKNRHEFAVEQLKKLDGGAILRENGFRCRAAHSGFWIDWKGNLLPCGLFLDPKINLLENHFDEAWRELVMKSAKICNCPDCIECDYLSICEVCAAKCYTETGRTDGKPAYQCEVTHEYVRQLMESLDQKEIEELNLQRFQR